MLSRPSCRHDSKDSCEICTVILDFPARHSNDLRSEQLKDDEVRKIVDCFEDTASEGTDFARWTSRGYFFNQGVLYRYAPDGETEEAQLVVPAHEREKIMKEHHDAPTASHYGVDGTYSRISSRYYWTGMRKYIGEYIKNCSECNRYKASNQKPAGLLQTPINAQCFETLSIDLFGPLPESSDGMKWVFIVEDCATKWVELFSLKRATAKECSLVLLNEIFLRYGLPRRLISDNGTQFVSSIMQQLCHILNIEQKLIPVYHPQSNPVERKNQDLKPRLAILVGNNHTSWVERLPAIQFAMNTAKCDSTGYTAAYLMFVRELRTPDDVNRDLRAIVKNDNFIPEITPYFKIFANVLKQVRERIERTQDRRKEYADRSRQPGPDYKPGDLVWVRLHPLSNADRKRSSKLMPHRDGPYIISNQRSPTSYEIISQDNPDMPLGVYHTSSLSRYHGPSDIPTPVVPLRRRGRPRKT